MVVDDGEKSWSHRRVYIVLLSDWLGYRICSFCLLLYAPGAAYAPLLQFHQQAISYLVPVVRTTPLYLPS